MPFDATPIEVRETENQRILREAARLVRQGWWDGSPGTEGNDNLCAAEALDKASNGRARNLHLLDAVCRHLQISNLPSWNDTPGRTAEEVATMFETVADGMG